VIVCFSWILELFFARTNCTLKIDLLIAVNIDICIHSALITYDKFLSLFRHKRCIYISEQDVRCNRVNSNHL